MYKDKSKQRQKNLGYQRRRRGCDTSDATDVSSASEGVTTGCDRRLVGVTSLREIAEKLVDPVWRERIERVSNSLGSLAGEVRLNGVTMSTWLKLCEAVPIA